MSFFLDEDKATRVSPDEYATGNKTNYNENLAAAWNYVKKTQLSISERWNLTNKYGEIVDAAHTLGHTDLTNPMIGEQQSYDETNLDIYTADDIDPLENRIQLFHEKLEKKQEEDANLRKLLRDKGLESQEGLQKQIGLEAQESFAKLQDVRSRATGYGKVGSFVGQAGVIADPFIIGTLPIGFAYSLPKSFLAAAGRIAMIESVLAATAETAIQYGYVGEYRKQLGFKDPDLEVFGLTLSPEQQKIGAATIGAAIGGPALLGFFRGLGKGFELTGNGLKNIRDKLDELPTHRIKRLYKEVVDKNPKLKSEPAEVSVKTNLAEDDNPFKDTVANNKEFDERIDEMADVVLRDKKPEKILEQPTAEIDLKLLDIYKSTVRTLDPEEIDFRPGEFQYKTDGDVFGVTEKLKGVEVWDQPSAGTLLVYEFADGTKAVVDGHQRLGLAKRLKGKGQDVKIIAHVFKETDNIPPEMMLVKGMLINLRNNTGTAVDAARVLRKAGKIDWEKIKKTLPLKQKLVRNADGLSKLSDDAWGLFLNKRIDEDLAARIGLIIDNKSIHNKLLASLSTRKFSSLQEIDTVLEQIKRTPTVKSEQETLFGKEFFEETLIFEKTALIRYVAQNSKKLKDVFKTVLANEKDLSSAGNVLNKSENLQRGIDNEKIYERLSNIATQVGKLSDEFNAAAAIYKQGNRKEAQRLAEEAVRKSVAAGDFDRFSTGGLQRTNETETPSSSISEEQAIEKVDPTEDLKHKDVSQNPEVVEKQIDDLNNNLFGEDLPQTGPRTKINLEEERLIDEIKDAEPNIANANKYLEHPLLKNKIEENIKFLKYTNNRPNFGTPEYFATRDYGNYGVGLEEFIQRVYGSGARVKERKLTIVMGPTAAGKSTYVDKAKNDLGAIVTDSDDIKKLMPEFSNGANADGVHIESSIINARILNRASQNGDNIIYPTTGRSMEKLNAVINKAESQGYTVKVKYITADRPELIMRNITRTFTKNRVVDSKVLLTEDVVKSIDNNYINLDEKYKIGKIDNSKRNFEASDFEGLPGSRQSIYKSLGHELRVEGYSDDIISKLDPEDQIPDETIRNAETGELENTTKSVKEILENERQDETFLARLKDCT
jgi:predicted ABC-type ATPase